MRRAVMAYLFLVSLAAPAFGQDPERLCFDPSGRIAASLALSACDSLIGETSYRDSYRARAYAWRGTIHQRSNNMAAALADFDAALKLDDDNYQARYGRAGLRYLERQYEAALADVNAAMALEPKASGPVMLRSAIYLGLKRYDEAIADADDKRFFGGVPVLCQRCFARAVAGVELDKARIACDQALWINPGNTAVLDSRAMVFLKQKRFDLALADYNSILQQAPRNARALYGRGVAAIALGRDKEGQNDIAQASAANRTIAATYAGYGITP